MATPAKQIPVVSTLPFSKADLVKPIPPNLLDVLEPFGTQQADPADVLGRLIRTGAKGFQAFFDEEFRAALKTDHLESVLRAMFILGSGLPDTNKTLGQTVIDHAPERCQPLCDQVVTGDMSLDTMKAILGGTQAFLMQFGGAALLTPGKVPTVAQVKFLDPTTEGSASSSFIGLAAGLSKDQTALTMFQQLINSQRKLDLPAPLLDALSNELGTQWKENPRLANQTDRNDHLAAALFQRKGDKNIPLDQRAFSDGLSNLGDAVLNPFDVGSKGELMQQIISLFGNASGKSNSAWAAEIEGLPAVPVKLDNGMLALFNHKSMLSGSPAPKTGERLHSVVSMAVLIFGVSLLVLSWLGLYYQRKRAQVGGGAHPAEADAPTASAGQAAGFSGTLAADVDAARQSAEAEFGQNLGENDTAMVRMNPLDIGQPEPTPYSPV